MVMGFREYRSLVRMNRLCPIALALGHFSAAKGICQPCASNLQYDGSVLPARCVVPPPSMAWLGPVIGVPSGAAVVVLLVALIVGYRRQAARRRLLQAVPQGEVAFVFTDIQNSTHLWESYPEMPEALEVHNEVMRDLIRGYGMFVFG